MEIKQINVYEFDERFYQRGSEFRPSLTYKLDQSMPASYGLAQWRGDVGNKRAEEIMDESARVGSAVHNYIEIIWSGGEVKSQEIRDIYGSKDCLKILTCLQAFMDWVDEVKPKILMAETITWNDQYNFAGTVDLICEIDGEKWVVDYKTSNSIHDKHKIQVSAYALSEGIKNAGILHLGNSTKKKYSWLPIKDMDKYLERFKILSNYFDTTYPNARPRHEVFPESFKLK